MALEASAIANVMTYHSDSPNLRRTQTRKGTQPDLGRVCDGLEFITVQSRVPVNCNRCRRVLSQSSATFCEKGAGRFGHSGNVGWIAVCLRRARQSTGLRFFTLKPGEGVLTARRTHLRTGGGTVGA